MEQSPDHPPPESRSEPAPSSAEAAQDAGEPVAPAAPDAAQPQGNDRMARADPQARRLAAVVAVVMLAVGGVLLWLLEARLRDIRKLVEENPAAAAEQALQIAAWVAWAGGAGLVGLGVWLWRLGRRINRTGRYPPPGMKLVRNTRIRTGRQARNLAGLAELFAFFAVVAGVVGMWYFYSAVRRLVGG